MAAGFDWRIYKGSSVRMILNKHPFAESLIPLLQQFEQQTGELRIGQRDAQRYAERQHKCYQCCWAPWLTADPTSTKMPPPTVPLTPSATVCPRFKVCRSQVSDVHPLLSAQDAVDLVRVTAGGCGYQHASCSLSRP